jgi:hypothetical protein
VGGSVRGFVEQVIGKCDAQVLGIFLGAWMGSNGDGVVGWLVGRAVGSNVVSAGGW